MKVQNKTDSRMKVQNKTDSKMKAQSKTDSRMKAQNKTDSRMKAQKQSESKNIRRQLLSAGDLKFITGKECLGGDITMPALFAWADSRDPPWNSHGIHPSEINNPEPRLTDLYFSDCFAYESLMLCYLGVHIGSNSVPEYMDIHLGSMRDGLQLSRYRRKPLIEETTYIKQPSPIAGGPLLIDDSLVFFIGTTYENLTKHARKSRETHYDMESNTIQGILRRDGFTSMHCNKKPIVEGGTCGYVRTKPLVTTGTQMYLNLVTSKSGMSFLIVKIEAWHCSKKHWQKVGEGKVKNNIDNTKFLVQFQNNTRMGEIITNTIFRVVFHFGIEVHLYSFWFSTNGKSGGYLGSGGYGLNRTRDL
jgi:hypothetical protein